MVKAIITSRKNSKLKIRVIIEDIGKTWKSLSGVEYDQKNLTCLTESDLYIKEFVKK